MARKKRPLGTLELRVLQFVQDRHPVSVREVTEGTAEAGGHARTTILTTMERLRAKGYLTRRKASGVNCYSPKASREELLQTLVGDFVDGPLGGSVSPFVAFLGRSVSVTGEELEELKRIVRSLDSGSSKESRPRKRR